MITQGAGEVIVAHGRKVALYATPAIPEEEMIDFNGAGDAFVGGFIAKLIEGKSIEECVRCGQWAARQIIKRSGCTFPAGPCPYSE